MEWVAVGMCIIATEKETARRYTCITKCSAGLG